ncbi:MAG: hypothetical protein AAB217_27570, partial [Chloroflexota bacterium]
MATLTQTLRQSRNLSAEIINWVRENIFGSVYTLLFNAALAGVAVVVFRSQFNASPALAGVIGGAWLIGLIWVIVSALTRRFNMVSHWLKDRLYNSAASTVITLLIVLLLGGFGRAAMDWAFVNASFSTDPVAVSVSEHTGATWGIISANLKLFMVGQFENDQLWRVWAGVALLAVLAVISFPVYGPFRDQLKLARRLVTWAWLL